jgi:hypothetical protein
MGSQEGTLMDRNRSPYMAMEKAPENEHQEADLWTWMVVGVIYAGVMVALWGPLIWEKTQG